MCDMFVFFFLVFAMQSYASALIALRQRLSRIMPLEVMCVVLGVRGKRANTASHLLFDVFITVRLLRMNNTVGWSLDPEHVLQSYMRVCAFMSYTVHDVHQ